MTEKELYLHAKTQESRMKSVLDSICNACLDLDTPHKNGCSTSFYIDYDERDMLNAITIFYHVASNYAIKNGSLTPENTTKKITKFRKIIKETFGFDTIQEIQIMKFINSIKEMAK